MSHMCAFAPDSPVVDGHVIVTSFAHIDPDGDFTPSALGQLMGYAVLVARVSKIPSYNLVFGTDEEAGVGVSHLAVHVIPRKKGDRLALPWSRARKPRVGSATEVFEDE
jgi:histidine triad (HIT) family protein